MSRVYIPVEELEDKASLEQKDQGKDTGDNKPTEQDIKELNDVVGELAKETGVPEEIIKRVMVFLRFTMFKTDGERTKFAIKYGIKDYSELYEWFKENKELLKRNDKFTEVFSVRFVDLYRSANPVIGSWIYKTFIIYQDIEDKEKYIRATQYASIFIIRAIGELLDNLTMFRKIINRFEKNKQLIATLIGSKEASKEIEEKEA